MNLFTPLILWSSMFTASSELLRTPFWLWWLPVSPPQPKQKKVEED
jgi:hypothetical protein